MKQQETYYDPDNQEYYTYEETTGANHHGKSAVYIVGYFLLLAIIVVPAQAAHMGMQGIFIAMVGAGVVLGLCILLFKAVKHRLENAKMSRGNWFRMLAGYNYTAQDASQGEGQGATTGTTSPAQPTAGTTALVKATGTAVQVYEEEELPDQILEDNPMYISDTFQPDVNSMLSATVLLCGRRRSGKSNGMGVLVEELAKYYTPFLLGDTEDEYSGLLLDPQHLPRGIMAGSADMQAEARRAGIRYVTIDREGAYEFGQSIPRDVLQVVLNLQSFTDDDEAAAIMSEIVEGMNAWEQARHNSKRIPCMFMLDEANKWLPQRQEESCIQDKETLYTLQRAIFGTMVRRGGKRGLGLILTTQRIAELDKRALQSIWKFLFQQGEEIDIARYTALGLDRDEVMTLRQGECFIFSPGIIGFRTMLRARHSEHQGHTPGLANLAEHLHRLAPMKVIATRNYTSIDAQAPVEEARPKQKSLEERGIEAWNNGAKSGRKLAAALSISENAGNQLMNRLLAKGLIYRPGQEPQVNEEA